MQTYTVPRTSPPQPPLDAARVLEQLDHILVAVVPQNDKAWFFKLVGKATAIERQRAAFQEFLESVQFSDDSSTPPTWKLPEGWAEKEAAVAMRDATLVIPDQDGELELSVSSLPLVEDWNDFLVPNVNRWLRQLQRGALSKETILKLAEPVSIQNGKATVFELSGVMAQEPMGGSPMARESSAPPKTSAPPAATQPPTTEQELTYDTPEGWQSGEMSSFRKAAFLLPGGGPTDGVTVTSFGSGPGSPMGDVSANVQRWAGQVNLKPPTEEELSELSEPITVGGVPGTYVELVSPADAASSQAIYVAMIQRGDQVWFFKMSGKSELLESQRTAFREFLDSVQFP